MKRSVASIALFALVAALSTATGCGPPSKHDILKKAEGVTTMQELEAALGAPDSRDKLGPVESWTYDTADGAVTFLLSGDKVQIQATLPPTDDEN